MNTLPTIIAPSLSTSPEKTPFFPECSRDIQSILTHPHQYEKIQIGDYHLKWANHSTPVSPNILIIDTGSSSGDRPMAFACMQNGIENWFYNSLAYEEEVRFLSKNVPSTRDWRIILSHLIWLDERQKRERLSIPPIWRWKNGKYEHDEQNAFLWTHSPSRPRIPCTMAFSPFFIREFTVSADTFAPVRFLW